MGWQRMTTKEHVWALVGVVAFCLLCFGIAALVAGTR